MRHQRRFGHFRGKGHGGRDQDARGTGRFRSPDVGADVRAAEAAGATGVLVPTPVTLAAEVADAPLVAQDLAGAVRLLQERR